MSDGYFRLLQMPRVKYWRTFVSGGISAAELRVLIKPFLDSGGGGFPADLLDTGKIPMRPHQETVRTALVTPRHFGFTAPPTDEEMRRQLMNPVWIDEWSRHYADQLPRGEVLALLTFENVYHIRCQYEDQPGLPKKKADEERREQHIITVLTPFDSKMPLGASNRYPVMRLERWPFVAPQPPAHVALPRDPDGKLWLCAYPWDRFTRWSLDMRLLYRLVRKNAGRVGLSQALSSAPHATSSVSVA